MLQPVLPLIEYHANNEYIASVLCENRDKPELACNGKCYLTKKMKESKKEHESHNHSIPQIDFSKYPIAPIVDAFNEYNVHEIFFKKRFYKLKEDLRKFSTSVFRPPIV